MADMRRMESRGPRALRWRAVEQSPRPPPLHEKSPPLHASPPPLHDSPPPLHESPPLLEQESLELSLAQESLEDDPSLLEQESVELESEAHVSELLPEVASVPEQSQVTSSTVPDRSTYTSPPLPPP